MLSCISTHSRFFIALFIASLLVSGCSSSSDSVGASNAVDDDSENVAEIDTTSGTTSGIVEGTDQTLNGNGSESETVVSGDSSVEGLGSTRITFDITVPAVMSDSLQVRLLWGDKDLVANWVVDESWVIVDDFPVNTTKDSVVEFSHGNGAIVLGDFRTTFRAGNAATGSFQITADQFDTQRWDSDGDGVSNLGELIGGTDPAVSVPLEPVSFALQMINDKTFRINWQPSAGAQFYRVLENPDGVSGYSQVSEDLDATTQRYDHRVALYNKTNARYIVQACRVNTCVDSAERSISGSLFNAIGYIKASNPDIYDHFGSAISLSADGTTLAVASFGEDSASIGIDGNQNDNSARSSGAVYVFVHINGLWERQAYIKTNNAESYNTFSSRTTLSLSATGDTLVVGDGDNSAATGINGDQSDNSVARSGAVYVFTRSGETWAQQAYIKASGPDEVDRFGVSVSLSADGTTLAVGADREDSAATGVNGNPNDNSAPDAGAVYLFEFSNGVWRQDVYLKASNAEAWNEFGSSVSLSADGNTLAVGAEREDSLATGINGDQSDDSSPAAGAVYVFARVAETWQQQAYVKASNTNAGDFFGTAVSLSADGNTLAVGADREDSSAAFVDGNQLNNSAIEAGAVYVFERNNQNWSQQSYVKASNAGRRDYFGNALSLSADGNSLAVGALYEGSLATGINVNQSDNSGFGSGAVYMFERSFEIWQQRAYIKASNTDSRDFFGLSVSLSADGETLAVGAVGEGSAATGSNGNQADDSVLEAGAVYLY